jgi:hypothetical protein
MLILTPPGFFGQYMELMGSKDPTPIVTYKNLKNYPKNDFMDAKIQVVVQILQQILVHWQPLYKQVLKVCDSEDDTSFLEGDKFVNRIYDDTTLKKPRIYAWGIACLKSFEESASDLLAEVARFRAEIFAHACNGSPELMALDHVGGQLEYFLLEIQKRHAEFKAQLDGVSGVTYAMQRLLISR